MKLLSNRFCVFFFTLILCITLLPLDSALARGRGGRGGGRGGGGASARTSSRTSLQNRGSFNSSRGTRQGSRSQTRPTNRDQNRQTRQGNQQERPTNRDQNRQTRQGNQQERQTNRDQNQQTRQGNQQERQANRDQNQQTRQGNQQERQSNRQDNQQNRRNFIDDNYDGDRWYGGGWYGGGYYAPPGWGAWTAAVGLAAGIAIGATVDSPPPYYSTVYVDSTPYIYSDGVYLEPQGSSYVVIAPPAGAVVTYLPDGCTSTQINGTQYFDCSGIYYQMVYQNGTTVYQVVQL